MFSFGFDGRSFLGREQRRFTGALFLYIRGLYRIPAYYQEGLFSAGHRKYSFMEHDRLRQYIEPVRTDYLDAKNRHPSRFCRLAAKPGFVHADFPEQALQALWQAETASCPPILKPSGVYKVIW